MKNLVVILLILAYGCSQPGASIWSNHKHKAKWVHKKLPRQGKSSGTGKWLIKMFCTTPGKVSAADNFFQCLHAYADYEYMKLPASPYVAGAAKPPDTHS